MDFVMSLLEVIVPVRNETGNVRELVVRIDKTMKEYGIKYRLIFIDDHSTDKTREILTGLKNRFPLDVYLKQGKRGKAYSILEGAVRAKSNYLAMIDGDLQYPPEAMGQMFALLQGKDQGIIIGKRSVSQESWLRNFISHSFSTVFGKWLHGFDCDIQSGLKLFKKEIIQHLDVGKITPWTLDLSLLITSRGLGLGIKEVDIKFSKRTFGQSKVNLLSTSFEIGLNALKMKFHQKDIYHISPERYGSMIGAGVVYKRKRLITHTTRHFSESALQTAIFWQKSLLVLAITSIITGLILSPVKTVVALIAVLTAIYFFDVVFNLYLILKSLHRPPEIHLSINEMKKLNEDTLPVYSILCPLYKEATVLPHVVEAIKRLDWPKTKLDVLLLLEENDMETISAACKQNLPFYFRILIVPHSEPKTKPKACNYGLAYTKGKYVVIYDAEDKPDPLQLKKAYLGFSKSSEETVCLQAKLNYYNPHQNLLTKLFTTEYSLWFDVILTGLQSIDTIIPLGGTSNHFKASVLKRLGGWDPFNVTEDCDLGVRLFSQGYKTAIINSTTLEEANSDLKNWLRQRSRWIKGYFQTYLVHMRYPFSFLSRHGSHSFIFQLIIGMRMSFMLINPLLWLMTLSYFVLHKYVGSVIESFYPAPVFYTAVFSMVFGNFMYIYNYMIGCINRRHYSLVKYVFLIPLYWLLASVAAFIALYQLITKPHFWEKTNHGLHLKPHTQTAPLLPVPEPAFPFNNQYFPSTLSSANGNVSPKSIRGVKGGESSRDTKLTEFPYES
ncbi:MAG: glycosyltransferase [bacterium]|nr:glycosyltransferase [bacterium]